MAKPFLSLSLSFLICTLYESEKEGGKGVHLRTLLVLTVRAPGPRQPPTCSPLLTSHLGGCAGGGEGVGEAGRLSGPGPSSPRPARSVGQPQAVTMFGAGAVLAGLQSFTQQFTVNLPLSVQCPVQRSQGEEVLGPEPPMAPPPSSPSSQCGGWTLGDSEGTVGGTERSVLPALLYQRWLWGGGQSDWVAGRNEGGGEGILPY